MRAIRRKAVSEKTGLSSPSIDRLERDGKFPPRIQLTDHGVAWIDEEVDEWIASRQRGPLKQRKELTTESQHEIMRS